MTIARSWHTAAKDYRCANCNGKIPRHDSYLRLFGMAEAGDKPYAIKLCVPCGKSAENQALTVTVKRTAPRDIWDYNPLKP